MRRVHGILRVLTIAPQHEGAHKASAMNFPYVRLPDVVSKVGVKVKVQCLIQVALAIEQILARSPANHDKDYKEMPTEEAASLRKADTSNTVEFWTTKKSVHGGFCHWFDELLGTMGVAAVGAEAPRSRYYKVQGKSGREAHERNVLGPVIVSAMHRSGLLCQCTLKQL